MKVRLTAHHTHAGITHAPGTVLHVDDTTAGWLDRHRRGIILDVDDAPASTTESHTVTAFRGRHRKRTSDHQENDQ